MSRSTIGKLAVPLCLAAAACPAQGWGQSGGQPALFAGTAIGDETLGTIAGREDTQQISAAHQVAGVSENSVGDNVRTGDARMSDNAFQGMSGLSIINVNTGNNVAINAAMNVNIAIQPAP